MENRTDQSQLAPKRLERRPRGTQHVEWLGFGEPAIAVHIHFQDGSMEELGFPPNSAVDTIIYYIADSPKSSAFVLLPRILRQCESHQKCLDRKGRPRSRADNISKAS